MEVLQRRLPFRPRTRPETHGSGHRRRHSTLPAYMERVHTREDRCTDSASTCSGACTISKTSYSKTKRRAHSRMPRLQCRLWCWQARSPVSYSIAALHVTSTPTGMTSRLWARARHKPYAGSPVQLRRSLPMAESVTASMYCTCHGLWRRFDRSATSLTTMTARSRSPALTRRSHHVAQTPQSALPPGTLQASTHFM